MYLNVSCFFQSFYYKKMLSQVWFLRLVAFYCACVCVKKGTVTCRFIFVSYIFIPVKPSKGWTETCKYSIINTSAQQWRFNRFCLLEMKFFFQLKLQARFLITVQIISSVFCSVKNLCSGQYSTWIRAGNPARNVTPLIPPFWDF